MGNERWSIYGADIVQKMLEKLWAKFLFTVTNKGKEKNGFEVPCAEMGNRRYQTDLQVSILIHTHAFSMEF